MADASSREMAIGDPHGAARLELAAWRERFNLVAGITTRGPDDRSNLSVPTQSLESAAWQALRASFQRAFPTIAISRQAHGTAIAQHEDGGETGLVLDGFDGHLTGRAGVLLVVTVADCVPVYLANPKRERLLLLHAGWRGIAAGILERGLALMAPRRNEVADIVMHCGVGICRECYDVGPEVHEQLGNGGGRGGADLRAILARRASTLGVRDITISPWCSRHDPQFHSHRRDAASSGRMAAFLGRPLP